MLEIKEKKVEQNKNIIISFNPQSIHLLDDFVIITYENNPFEDLRAAYSFHKDIKEYLNKKIIFNFNNIYLEISEKTNSKSIIESYDYYDDIYWKSTVNDTIKQDIDKLEKASKADISQIRESLNNLFLARRMFNCTKPIISFSNKRRIEKLTYKLFSENTKYSSLQPMDELPKVKVKR